jgi:hypothetical protein
MLKIFRSHTPSESEERVKIKSLFSKLNIFRLLLSAISRGYTVHKF